MSDDFDAQLAHYQMLARRSHPDADEAYIEDLALQAYRYQLDVVKHFSPRSCPQRGRVPWLNVAGIRELRRRCRNLAPSEANQHPATRKMVAKTGVTIEGVEFDIRISADPKDFGDDAFPDRDDWPLHRGQVLQEYLLDVLHRYFLYYWIIAPSLRERPEQLKADNLAVSRGIDKNKIASHGLLATEPATPESKLTKTWIIASAQDFLAALARIMSEQWTGVLIDGSNGSEVGLVQRGRTVHAHYQGLQGWEALVTLASNHRGPLTWREADVPDTACDIDGSASSIIHALRNQIQAVPFCSETNHRHVGPQTQSARSASRPFTTPKSGSRQSRDLQQVMRGLRIDPPLSSPLARNADEVHNDRVLLLLSTAAECLDLDESVLDCAHGINIITDMMMSHLAQGASPYKASRNDTPAIQAYLREIFQSIRMSERRS